MNELSSFVAQHAVDTFVEHTHALIALIEADGKLSALNPAFENLATKSPVPNMIEDFLACDSHETYRDMLDSVRRENRRVRDNLNFRADTAEDSTCFDCILTPLPDERMLFIAELAAYDSSLPGKYYRLTKLVAQLRVDYDQVKKILMNKQTELDAVVAQADEVSHTDSLTYLPNRRQAMLDLPRELLHAERYQTPFTISLLDIDHFKQVNDTYGHAVGDDVLKHVANILREHVRHPDIAARFGGEEFLILLPNSDSAAAVKQAIRLCNHLRKNPFNSKGQVIQVTASVGIAQFGGHPESWQELLGRADAGLYQAKNNGRDGYSVAE